jgi:hypothetical protein
MSSNPSGHFVCTSEYVRDGSYIRLSKERELRKTPREKLMSELFEKTKLPEKFDKIRDDFLRDEIKFYKVKYGYEPSSGSEELSQIVNNATYKLFTLPEYIEYHKNCQILIKEYMKKYYEIPPVIERGESNKYVWV